MAEARPLGLGDPPRLGRYRLEARLGEGGQGIVYLGRDSDGGRVAVKLLRAQLGEDEAMRSRFARELAVIEQVAGFCTAQVLDADVAGDQPYIVSEYVPGPSLHDLVREHGPRAGTELDRLAIGTATAMAAIHRAGIVHRDFKPANVLIGPDGPRVIDFGIARALESGADSTTASGVVGTPAYMAPEQIAGQRVTPAADVFAWAATMVFAATGRSPFGGDSIPAVMNRISHHAADLSGVPVTLLPLLERCLAKDPTGRPAAQTLLLELIGDEAAPAAPHDETAHDGPGREPERFPAAPPPPGPVPPPVRSPPPFQGLPPSAPRRRTAGRRTGLMALGAVGGALLLGAAAVGAWAYAPRAEGSLGLPADGTTILRAASIGTRAFASFDYRSIDTDMQSAHATMTPGMQRRYDSQMTTSIRPAAERDKVVNQATVVADGLESARGTTATVLIFVNQQTATRARTPTANNIGVRAGMVRQDGQWRLDQITPLPASTSTTKASWPGSATSSVLNAAKSCVTALSSVDYRYLDGTLAAVSKCGTGEFRDQWNKSQTNFRSTIIANRVTSHLSGINTALTESTSPSQATVLILAATQVRTVNAPSPATKISRYKATMTRTGDKWLLAKVDIIT
ncbi:hypothetical protein GCM10029978_089890 [Actinoallomurus acanthiterrae]